MFMLFSISLFCELKKKKKIIYKIKCFLLS